MRGRRRVSPERMLSEDFLRTLHKRMLGDVWEWAGTFRTTERNIGVQAYRIGVELGSLLRDVLYWTEHEHFRRTRLRSGSIIAWSQHTRFPMEMAVTLAWRPIF